MLLDIAASKAWTIKSNDIKNAYNLQGEEIDRLIHGAATRAEQAGQAVEAEVVVGRKWYFRVEKVLTGLGCKKSQYDHCIFTYKVQDNESSTTGFVELPLASPGRLKYK